MSDKNQESVDFKVDLTKTPEEIQKEHEEKKEAAKSEEVKDVKKDEAEVKELPQEPEAKEEKPKDVPDGKVESKSPEKISEEGGELSKKQEIIKDYLSSTYNIDESQLKDVLSNNEKTEELPEDVSKYLQFKKETGRGLDDFLMVQQDFSQMDEVDLIGNYLSQSNPEYSDEDISFYMEDKFLAAEGEDERTTRAKALAMKQELQKAKEYFSTIQEKYYTPLESSAENVPEDYKKALEFYQQFNEDATKTQQVEESQRRVFSENTRKYFNDEFKGFEFNLGDKKLNYQPKNIKETVEQQSDLGNFIKKYLDENGNLTNAKEYHTALSMAMNPNAYAKFFYEQGKADAVNNVVRDGKNINMNVRTNVESSQPGPKFRVLQDTQDFSRGLRIKSKK